MGKGERGERAEKVQKMAGRGTTRIQLHCSRVRSTAQHDFSVSMLETSVGRTTIYCERCLSKKKIKWEDDKRQKEKRERYLQELVALESQILLDLRTRKNSTWCNSLTNNKTRVCGVYCRVKRRGREAFFIFHVWKRKGEANLPVHQRRRLPERTAFQHHLPSVYPSHPLANLLPISR